MVTESAFSTGWYWTTFAVSFVCFWILLLYYSGSLAFYILLPYWCAIVLAVGLGIWSAMGLLARYRLRQRASERAARRQAAATSEDEDEEVVYRENIVVRLFKLLIRIIVLLFLFVWNTVMRIVYIIEVTILRLIILGYDIIYYLLYFAWSTVYHVVRLALRIVRFALRVAWKILRILTRLPLARRLWDRRLMPAIMGRWNASMASRRERAATRLDQKRRLAAARGKDPDAWQKDQERRHHFPLPHPHDARKGLRDRIDERQRLDYNRRDRWAAHRRGKPIPPKLHSERRKRKIEQKGQKRANEKDAKKKDKKRRDGPDEEKAAADKEMAEAAEKPKGKRGEPVRRPNARSAEE